MDRRLLTAEEFMQLEDVEAPVELVRGVVSDLPFPFPRHGQVCMAIVGALGNVVMDRSPGYVLCNFTCIITERNPDTVRCCDICQSKVPSGSLTGDFLPAPPDLIVEVVSPNDLRLEVETKISEYLEAGVAGVCVVDPTIEGTRICRKDRDEEQLKNGDTLRFEDVLPGFSVPLKHLFE